jgi:hypothetical protein
MGQICNSNRKKKCDTIFLEKEVGRQSYTHLRKRCKSNSKLDLREIIVRLGAV